MPLANMKELLIAADQGSYAVGAFGVADMQMVMGAVEAAEALRSPLILQIAQIRLPWSPLNLMAPMMLAAAKNAKVPVAVHLDHGLDVETVEEALGLGFTSVMIDGSMLPLEDNIQLIQKARTLAGAWGASVEAEIGQLGRTEEGKESQVLVSDPKEAVRMCRDAGPDALAVSIGNAHGRYKQEPHLDFGLLEKLHRITPVPLVLHGGTGISGTDFGRCVKLGIRKINIATAGFEASLEAARGGKDTEHGGYFEMSRQMARSMADNVRKHILYFGSEGRV